MPIQVHPDGPRDAKIMVVGEAPSRNEILAGKPFIGSSGRELDKMLHEAGILRSECFLTNVARVQPPRNDIKKFFLKDTPKNRIPGPEILEGIELLKQEIAEVQPNVIIALGDTALWALTGERGITKWRGSILTVKPEFEFDGISVKVIPTFHPSAILRKWDWRFIAVQDLRRAAAEAAFPEINYPDYQFIIRPSFETAMRTLDKLLNLANGDAVWGDFTGGEYHGMSGKKDAQIGPRCGTINPPKLMLTGDIETRRGHIACLGIGWSKTEAICIPFICVSSATGYWSEEEEVAIVCKLRDLFAHPEIGWVFQNGLYDYQYLMKHWKFVPRLYMDTMLAQHTCFAGLQKGLDFQSSIYCEYHRYWKDEGKEFHESIKSLDDEDTYWIYNCKDCVSTYEIAGVHEKNIRALKAQAPYAFQMDQFYPVLTMMLRGVRIDKDKKTKLFFELTDAIAEREQWMQDVLGKVLNPRSPKQMQNFFYNELGLPAQKNRKTGRPTANDEALQKLAKKEPLVQPVVKVISEIRSLGVFLSTFVKAPTSEDGRMRSSYNIAGTETFRWSSAADAFGQGMNLQNIPKGNE